VYDNYENNLLACFAVAKTQKKIKPVVVKVELRKKRQQKNRVLPPYQVNLQKFHGDPFDE